MALLVHHNFPDEEANGVAVTNNPFDSTGLDPAFYVNVQFGGDVEVVAPPSGVTNDAYLQFFSAPNQPVSYLTHSSLVPAGTTVLSPTQVHELGVALDAIHKRFSPPMAPRPAKMAGTRWMWSSSSTTTRTRESRRRSTSSKRAPTPAAAQIRCLREVKSLDARRFLKGTPGTRSSVVNICTQSRNTSDARLT